MNVSVVIRQPGKLLQRFMELVFFDFTESGYYIYGKAFCFKNSTAFRHFGIFDYFSTAAVIKMEQVEFLAAELLFFGKSYLNVYRRAVGRFKLNALGREE